jgi:serine/threonine-protein kinase
MRIPAPDELAGGARGTARAPRSAGQRRPGSARHKAEAVRKRRIALAVLLALLIAVLGVGGWLATNSDGAVPPGQHRSPSATTARSP